MPDDYEIIDDRFRRFVLSNAPLQKLGEGFGWLEGPVWFADHQCLLFSDIPNDRVLRWTASGGISVFREPSGFENGHTRDGPAGSCPARITGASPGPNSTAASRSWRTVSRAAG